MKISIIQSDIIWEDKPGNLTKLGKLIKPLYNKTDIVVLPEMFNTGFSINPEKLYESPKQETYLWMRKIAMEGDFGLSGSYIIKEQSHFYNRLVFVTPGEEIWHYDKRHLFTMAGENKLFQHGKDRLVLNFRGFRISPYICYDLRFPVWSRNREDYDLLIYVANWPESRSEVWKTLLKARAIENQCFVAGVNRIGTDGNGVKYGGNSVIIDPRGGIIADAESNDEVTITGELSLSELSDFRKKFPVLNDADDFTINY